MRSRQNATAAAALALASVMTSCASPSGPFDPDAEIRPDLLEVRPDVAAAGEHVELLFPEETVRGVGYVLERRNGDTWDWKYGLASTGGGGGEPTWWSASDSDRYPVPDIGVMGPGPDLVTIPDSAEPGDYRLCTSNAGDNFCAQVTVGQ